jgi:hypothetical protein
MFILLEVQWVDQSNQPEPSQRIRHIGGNSGQVEWHHTEAQAIEFIEHGHFAYFVKKAAGTLNLEVGRTADGGKYLTILAGGGHPQLLLDLPGCPHSVTLEPVAFLGSAAN